MTNKHREYIVNENMEPKAWYYDFSTVTSKLYDALSLNIAERTERYYSQMVNNQCFSYQSRYTGNAIFYLAAVIEMLICRILK